MQTGCAFPEHSGLLVISDDVGPADETPPDMMARMDQADADEHQREDVRRSYRRAAIVIAVANLADIILTFRALDHGRTEGNPIAAWMIDHTLVVPAKVLVCAFILAVAYSPAAWFASRLTEVSVRRVWFVAGVYSVVVLVGVLANLR